MPQGLMLTDLSLSLTAQGGESGNVAPPQFNCLLFNSTLGPFMEADLPFPFFEE